MKILYNYAHNLFYGSQILNTRSGYDIGGFDKVYPFKIHDIDANYYNQNKHILNQPKGAGYWIWKYYFAEKLLNNSEIPENSYIFYADSGSKFVDNIDHLISVMSRDDLSIMTFRQLHLSYIWTKRDMFILTDTDGPKYTHTAQRCGGWFLLKKDNNSRNFINQCHKYALDYRIITDSPNEMGLNNYDGFITHRHDESLISIVSKKWNLYPYRNPSQDGFVHDVKFTNNIYGEEGFNKIKEKFSSELSWIKSLDQYPPISIDDKSTYPAILLLHRNPN